MKRTFNLVAVAAASCLMIACGGGERPVASVAGTTANPLAVPADSLSLYRSIESLRVPAGELPAAVAPSLRSATGPIDVWVSLTALPVSLKKKALRPDVAGVSWKATDAALQNQLQAHKALLRGGQDTLVSALRGLGARELGRVLVSHNAVAVRVDAARLAEIAALPDVAAVRPVRHYELMLGETVPYVGGSAAQGLGFDGTGTRVAVLDSGIDYTHRNLGGAGTPAAYAAAYGSGVGDALQTTRDGLFPTAKVMDGFDFVGESWPNGDRTEDPDPIDYQGHGTHVADIIAGVGPNRGVAPGAQLVAVKVCSAVATSCNGVALLRGMDFALDPNDDGDLSDAVDVINLSLGSSYGQDEDDLSFAAANAVKLGVSVVASAGNSANRPYIVGSPSSAPGVLSVAQTQVPSANVFPLAITAPAAIQGRYNNTASLDWAPLAGGIAGDVVFVGRGCAGDSYLAPPAGKVALIDRGACSISQKVRRASDAGATGILIGQVAAGDAQTFSNGGECPAPADGACKPSIVITQAVSDLIKGQLGMGATVSVSVSKAVFVNLAGSMVASSSRGPGFSASALKPEIGAPGASVSAIAGSATGEQAFGGTSGASPMVAGAAAVLRGAFPMRSPEQIKAMLMNSAHTEVYTNPATLPGVLAPVSRIGAGELRADRALGLSSIAHNVKARTAALPFGFAEVDRKANLDSELLIENFGATDRTYTLSAAYRYADDAASGATAIEMSPTVTVAAGGTARIAVRMKVDGTRLPVWGLGDAGVNGGNGALLEGNEVDGYVTLRSGGETLTVPFHALLRKSAAVAATGTDVRAGADLRLQNTGANAGYFDLFALTGTSPQMPKKSLPGAGDSLALIDLRAVGVRAVGDALQFGVSRFDRRAHPAYPAEMNIHVDANNDGVDDFLVYNAEVTGFAASGQSVVYVVNLSTGAGAAYFYLIADLQSGNAVFTVPMVALGLTPTSKFRFSVYAFDNYFTGSPTDAIVGMTHTPATPRYALQGGVYDGPVAAGQTLRLKVTAVAGGAAASPSQTGLLLMYAQNKTIETQLVTVKP
ncbi:MAG: S8 family serine peptidase [Hydrogenophaga sp.]|uniref:S8 family peptidase n=1 Tax=Hydrogenophaga sp. TaxID=1904254 RepID=UPI00271CE711|nr:S8 family serine peptidase [Hydrogenophaga sp.]MDO9149713.1 S8 family serine peptidase [Hydrogenophaga sp.]MDO9603540.1 S8 family serine peptidase [Hydrogenophaga sp.]